MSRSATKASMSPMKTEDVVAPAPAPVPKRTTRSTNNDADSAGAPASKRQRKDEPTAVERAAEEHLDVEAPGKSPSPAGDASRQVKKTAKTKENIRTMIAYGKGKGKAKAAGPTNPDEDVDDIAASAVIEAEKSAAGAPKTRGRKPLPSISSPKFPSPTEPGANFVDRLKAARDIAGDDLADAALESVADKNKENLAMRGKNAAGRQTGRKNFIDRQADAEKVSQIADFEEENDQQLRHDAESKASKEAGDNNESDDVPRIEGQPEVVSLAGVKRRGKPLTRDVPREESVDQQAARESYNAQLRKEKAARDLEREHELEREEMRKKKGGPGQQVQQPQQPQQPQQQAPQAPMGVPRQPPQHDEAPPTPSFSDMKKVAKEKAALHRQQRGSIKPRKPWTADEEDVFARLIEEHGCNWAQLERTEEMKKFGGRTQSQLKDKAMNMKALIMKAEAPLPKNFQFISLRATQKEDIRSLGIDPDNYPY